MSKYDDGDKALHACINSFLRVMIFLLFLFAFFALVSWFGCLQNLSRFYIKVTI
jgi:hypothetical protein